MGDDKAARMLDAAEDLLVRFGYRRTTVDDVARIAGVGKGTIYLYWPTKSDLFGTVLVRESARVLAEQLAVLEADPAEARLHRLMRHTYLQTMGRPLSRAFATRDHEILGELLTHGESGARFIAGKVDTTVQYLQVLHRHGLLTDDPATDRFVFHRLSALVLGTFLLDGMPGMEGLSLEAAADALATTVRRAFEPAAEPAAGMVRDAAHELTNLCKRWARELDDALPG